MPLTVTVGRRHLDYYNNKLLSHPSPSESSSLENPSHVDLQIRLERLRARLILSILGCSKSYINRTPESHLRVVCRSRIKFWNFGPRYVFFRIKIAKFWTRCVRKNQIKFCKDRTLCRSSDIHAKKFRHVPYLGCFRLFPKKNN